MPPNSPNDINIVSPGTSKRCGRRCSGDKHAPSCPKYIITA